MASACAHDVASLAFHKCEGINQRIHALVIGVGRYYDAAPRFGRKLDSLPGASLGAFRFAHYLINEFQAQEPRHRRLATLRLLLSPMKREEATVAGLPYKRAERKDVAIALQDWADDCDDDDQNLAVLYVAGHGVALRKSSSLLFLADAPTERSLAQSAVNLAVTEARMRNCAARDNLFVYDCCAVPPGDIPTNQEGAIAINKFPKKKKEGGKKRAGLVCINAARVGLGTFAIGSDGTLLARGLLGDYRDRAGDDALLRIAGELGSGQFGITPARLAEMLSPQLEKIALEKKVPADGYEASLTGKFPPGPITVPRPTPEFEVTLTGLTSGRVPPVSISLLPLEGGTVPLSPDARDIESLPIPAGDYTLQINSSGRDPTFEKLQVTRPMSRAVPG